MGAEYLNLALLPKNVPAPQMWYQLATGNVWQWVHSDSPNEGQKLNPEFPVLRANFTVTFPLCPRHPGEPDTGWEIMLCPGSSWLLGSPSRMVGGTSMRHDQCNLHPAWLWGMCKAQIRLSRPPCWKKGDGEGRTPRQSLICSH